MSFCPVSYHMSHRNLLIWRIACSAVIAAIQQRMQHSSSSRSNNSSHCCTPSAAAEGATAATPTGKLPTAEAATHLDEVLLKQHLNNFHQHWQQQYARQLLQQRQQKQHRMHGSTAQSTLPQAATNLDEVLLEQQLNNFLQDGQQARVMHTNASLQ